MSGDIKVKIRQGGIGELTELEFIEALRQCAQSIHQRPVAVVIKLRNKPEYMYIATDGDVQDVIGVSQRAKERGME